MSASVSMQDNDGLDHVDEDIPELSKAAYRAACISIFHLFRRAPTLTYKCIFRHLFAPLSSYIPVMYPSNRQASHSTRSDHSMKATCDSSVARGEPLESRTLPLVDNEAMIITSAVLRNSLLILHRMFVIHARTIDAYDLLVEYLLPLMVLGHTTKKTRSYLTSRVRELIVASIKQSSYKKCVFHLVNSVCHNPARHHRFFCPSGDGGLTLYQRQNTVTDTYDSSKISITVPSSMKTVSHSPSIPLMESTIEVNNVHVSDVYNCDNGQTVVEDCNDRDLSCNTPNESEDDHYLSYIVQRMQDSGSSLFLDVVIGVLDSSIACYQYPSHLQRIQRILAMLLEGAVSEAMSDISKVR